MKLSALVLSLLVSTVALGAPARVVVMPFSGAKAKVARDQFSTAICAEHTCLPAKRISKGTRPDYAKARKDDVNLVITARVSGSAKKRVLAVQVFDAKGKRVYRENYELAKNGKLTDAALEKATERLNDAASRFEPAQPPTKAEPPPAVVEAPTPVREEPPARVQPQPPPAREQPRAEAPRQPVVERTERPQPREEAPLQEEPREPRSGGEKRPLLVLEVGGDFIRRDYSYSGLRIPNLRSYQTQPVMFAPRARVELYPLARMSDGILGGLGIEADYLMAVALESTDENDRTYPTTANRLDAGVRLNFHPLGPGRLMVAPILGYRMSDFEVGVASDGERLTGLPALSYRAARAGAVAEYSFGRVTPFLRAEYVHLLSLGEIGEAPFFADSSGRAIEASAGVGVRVHRLFEVRAGGHFTQYSLSFTPAENATYSASGATDNYFGGSLMVRFSY
jgi:hypothetical protein